MADLLAAMEETTKAAANRGRLRDTGSDGASHSGDPAANPAAQDRSGPQKVESKSGPSGEGNSKTNTDGVADDADAGADANDADADADDADGDRGDAKGDWPNRATANMALQPPSGGGRSELAQISADLTALGLGEADPSRGEAGEMQIKSMPGGEGSIVADGETC